MGKFYSPEASQNVPKSKRLLVQNFTVAIFFNSLFLSFSIFTGSLIHEHYTRECEFGNFDKIKNKKHKKKKTQKKHKNFWLNFCLNKECPKLLCGLGICHRRRQTIQMWNSSGEKKNSSGHHCMSGVCCIEHYVMTW